MRVLGVLVLVAILIPAATQAARTERSPSPTPIPDDVRLGLAQLSIGVSSPGEVKPSSLPVRYKQALRIARKKVGWMIRPAMSGWVRVHRITLHLVRLTPPPVLPERRGFVSAAPLRIGDLAWLVVVRDATIPVLGPPGGTYIAPLAVLVRTDQARFVVAMSL
jgi:hypothetical protein